MRSIQAASTRRILEVRRGYQHLLLVGCIDCIPGRLGLLLSSLSLAHNIQVGDLPFRGLNCVLALLEVEGTRLRLLDGDHVVD